MTAAVDLFAGPGGWDEGIRDLGIVPLGIEWDDAARATREAAGHRTLRADVAELDPADFAPCELLIASPPCQAFSAAGKGGGHRDVPLILECVQALAHGDDRRAEIVPHLEDARSLLVVEPLRWALALEPTFVACEQVPPVLTLWEEFAAILRVRGWQTWTGLLSAEQFGVPQTRERAFLLASRAGRVLPPSPTHQRYVPMPREREQPSLFDAGERSRIVLPGEEHLLPWVSMAESLGWDEGERAYRLARGEGMLERHGDRAPTPDDRPAPVMTSKARTATWVYRNGNQERAAERPADEPAPTVHFGHALNDVRWVAQRPAPTIVTTRRSKDGLLIGRQLPEGEGENVGGWGWERPSTTVACDPRVFQPGGHHEPGKQSENAVRVTLAEAAILQSFPADYPFQGSRTKQFEQVGNAVPPLLAQAVIAALTTAQDIAA